MKKNTKLNNKGFILAETLIATVFVAVIFSVILINFYPMIGEYEKRENYDDIDSKYGAYWVKKLIEDSNDSEFDISSELSDRDHIGVTCYDLYKVSTTKRNRCIKIYRALQIFRITLTNYNIKEFKEAVPSSYSFSNVEKDYINYLPKYDSYPSLYGAKYRVIVEFNRKAKDELGKEYTYQTFSTMEVNK